MRISQNGIEFIKRWEKLELVPYKDVAGVLTIGYGHTKDVFAGQIIDELEAERLLRMDLADAENAVNYYLRWIIGDLNQSQFDALVSLVFNVGSGNIFTKKYQNGYGQGSTLYNKLLALDFQGASERFTDFVNSAGKFTQGLLNRRLAEKELFLKKKV